MLPLSSFVVLMVAPSHVILVDDVSCCNCNDFLTVLKNASNFLECGPSCAVIEDLGEVSPDLTALTSDVDWSIFICGG